MKIEDDLTPESESRFSQMLEAVRDTRRAEADRIATALRADPKNGELLAQWEKNREFLCNSYVVEGHMHLSRARYAFLQARFAPGGSIASSISAILAALLDAVGEKDEDELKTRDGPLQWARGYSPLAQSLFAASPRAAAARRFLFYISRTLEEHDPDRQRLAPAISDLVTVSLLAFQTFGLYSGLVPRHMIPHVVNVADAASQRDIRDRILGALTAVAGKKYNDRRVMRSVLKAIGWEEKVIGGIMKEVSRKKGPLDGKIEQVYAAWMEAPSRVAKHYPIADPSEKAEGSAREK